MKNLFMFALIGIFLLALPALAQVKLLHEFAGAPDDGDFPYGSLIISGSTLYGMTYVGGANSKGTIFSIQTDGSGFTLLHSFAGGTEDGANPSGDLLLIGGTLFGMTEAGGDSDYGTIFKIESTGSGFALLHEFAGGTDDGRRPSGSLIVSGSTLYGATNGGGDFDSGMIFKIQTDGNGYLIILEFGVVIPGCNPSGSLVLFDSTLYGTTYYCGASGKGAIFKVGIDGTGSTLLHEFSGGTDDGAYPVDSLFLSGSTLYGATGGQGYSDLGTIYKIQTDGSGFTQLHRFAGGADDGANPNGPLVLSGSALIGMSFKGGTDAGTIFKLQTDGSGFSLLHRFGARADGIWPSGSLLLSDTTLYGMTLYGGDNDNGVIFSLSLMVTSPNGGESWMVGTPHDITWQPGITTNNVNIDYSTDSGVNWNPVATNEANDGSYAWTVPDAISGNCLVRVQEADGSPSDQSDATFSIIAYVAESVSTPSAPSGRTTGGLNSGYTFSTDGSSSSWGDTVQYKFDWGDGSDSGWLAVGTTSAQHSWAAIGSYNIMAMARCATHTNVVSAWSAVHAIAISSGSGGNCNLLHEFAGGDGQIPEGSLILSASTLYGLTSYGGTYDGGMLFKLQTDGSAFTQMKSFFGDEYDRYEPRSLLLSGTTLYGATYIGGMYWSGSIFKIEADGSGYIDILHMGGGGVELMAPCDLVLSGTTLYGVAQLDGVNYLGGIFKVETDGTGFTILHSFTTGEYYYGNTGRIIVSGSTIFGVVYSNYDYKGRIFTIQTDGTGFTVLHEFTAGVNDGMMPSGKLVLSGSTLFGTTMYGGDSDKGTLYAIQTDGSGFTLLHEFTGGSTDGSRPRGTMYLSGSTLYGLTSQGGTHNLGTLFRMQTDGSGYELLHEFAGGTGDGAYPLGSLILSDSTLYGMTYGGGDNDLGVVYSLQVSTSTSITVTAPNGGESWTVGSSHDITWSSTGVIDNVNIEYSTDNGFSWNPVASNEANDGSYAWTIPDAQSSNCLVRVGDTDGDPSDPSDAIFTIAVPDSITVTAPNGGETWTAGSTQEITWTSTGTIANVNIDYSTDNGSNWTPVAAGTENDGSYSWTVPSTPSVNCLVRVRDALDNDPSDSSDAVFTIAPASAETVSAPSTPSGPTTGTISTSYDFSTGGSTSNLEHALQYKFDWDDGTDSGWLAVGTTTASHSWAVNGTYDVRAMARCADHPTVESIWSATLAVIISDGVTTGPYNSPAQYKVLPEVIWSAATGGGTWISNVQVTDVSGGSQVSVYYNAASGRRGPFLLWDNSGGGALSSVKYANLLQTIDGLDSETFTYYGTVGAVEFITQDGSH
ncbi:MAG: hypothetical protein KKB32_04040, partial [Acidobacteria bacterium]|nr:hypothetical protein [Acidobacteriota bacterium]